MHQHPLANIRFRRPPLGGDKADIDRPAHAADVNNSQHVVDIGNFDNTSWNAQTHCSLRYGLRSGGTAHGAEIIAWQRTHGPGAFSRLISNAGSKLFCNLSAVRMITD